jgi:hypothetical protein
MSAVLTEPEPGQNWTTAPDTGEADKNKVKIIMQ